MNLRTVKEARNFLAMAVFFGGGFLWSREFIAVVSNDWDYILMQMLTMMNGLGLVMVLVAWGIRVRDRRTETLESPPIKLSKSSDKCS